MRAIPYYLACAGDTVCQSDCNRAHTEALRFCPCHANCFNGCPCTYESDFCVGVYDTCLQDNHDENEVCRSWAQQRWNKCLNGCEPFDAGCENICTNSFEVDIASCPCNQRCMDGCPCQGNYQCGTILTTTSPTTTSQSCKIVSKNLLCCDIWS